MLLSHDGEWIRCISDFFPSNFASLKDEFAVIFAFCKPSNPLRIWNETREKCLTDFRRRNVNSFLETEALRDDAFSEKIFLNDIKDSPHETRSELDLQKVVLL